MTSHPPRPRLAVIVGNAITGDSRVQKTALSAAYAGWDVLLVGRSRTQRVERTWYGPVKVVRVPLGTAAQDAEARRRARTLRSRITQAGLPTPERAAQFRTTHEIRARRRGELIGRLASAGAAGKAPWFVAKVWRRLLEEGFSLRSRAYDWEQRHHPDADRVVGRWERDYPQVLDLDLALGPVIEEFEPDVIHANDITMLHTAAVSAGRLRSRGREVAWIYDAHEYVAGVEWPTARSMSALPAMERDLIHRADAVVTVSPEIAELIRNDHKLATTPLVVRNVPIREAVGSSTESVRAAAGVADDVPLLVYSGYIHHERSIGTAVEALPQLDGFHLAIVSGQTNPELRKILALAEELHVDDRVHVVPYVAQHEVADYLSSADLGVILSKKTINYEMSLPTKLAEYIHGRLPVVVSDVRTLSAFVREHGIGEVFEAGDAESFRKAVLAAMPRRAELSANISDEILAELSWERQSARLLDLYATVSPVGPPADPGVRPDQPWEVHERARKSPKAEQSDDEAAPERHWRQLEKTPIRLGLGPANFAGQLAAIAQAVTDARTDVSAEVFMTVYDVDFGFPADVYLNGRDFNGRTLRALDARLAQVRRILPRYSHLIADAFRTVSGGLTGTDIGADIPMLHRARIKVALLAHGSDIRDPELHMEQVPHSLFRDAPDEDLVAERTRVARRNLGIVEEFGLPLLVTTPDLLAFREQATWLPLVVDVEKWRHDRPVLERSKPVVLHAPSKRWTKGTDRFIGQLLDLERRGLIEVDLVEGLRWQEMRERVHRADIVVDQVSIGSYGVFACEAMAAGKPVIAYLSEDVETVLGPHPIVNATPDTVGAAVESLLDDRAAAAQRGLDSAAYAQRVHDGQETVRRLAFFLR